MELENEIVYGPVFSRRFGWDLGINLLPAGHKVCSYDCVYCQYGFTPPLINNQTSFVSASEVIHEWSRKLTSNADREIRVAHTTISGNGEPTMHPRFPEVVSGIVAFRDRYYPKIRLSVLSTGYRAGNDEIRRAMEMLDEPVVKFDSVIREKQQCLNRPLVPVNLPEMIDDLKKFRKLILQTMFVHNWNDSVPDLRAWRDALLKIKPNSVQIYTISREPALKDLQAVKPSFLTELAERTTMVTGIPVYAF